MNSILDNFLVGLVLLISAGYLVSSLGPRSLRRGLLGALSRLAALAPKFLGLRRLAAWLAGASAGKSRGACGGCDGCGSAPPSASQHNKSQSTQTTQPSVTEVSVPAAKIGRRA